MNWFITFGDKEIPFTRSRSKQGAWNLFFLQRPALSHSSIKDLIKLNYKANKEKEGKRNDTLKS